MESFIDHTIEDMTKANHKEIKNTSEHLNEALAKLKVDLINNVDLAKNAGVTDTAVVEDFCLKIVALTHEKLAEHVSNMHEYVDETAGKTKIFMVSVVKEEVITRFGDEFVQYVKDTVLEQLREDAKTRLTVQQIKNMVLEDIKADLQEEKKRLSAGMSEEWKSERSSVSAELRDEVKRLESMMGLRFRAAGRTLRREEGHEVEEALPEEVEFLKNYMSELELKILDFERHLPGNNVCSNFNGGNAYMSEENHALKEELAAVKKAMKKQASQLELKVAELQQRLPSNEERLKFVPVARNASPYSQITMAPSCGDGLNVKKSRKWVVTDVVANENFDERSLGVHPAFRKKDLKSHLGMDEDSPRSDSGPRLGKK